MGCNDHDDYHGGVSCTTRRRMHVDYLIEDSENALLCELCYPHPRRLVASQLRLTPCQCRCEICALDSVWRHQNPQASEPGAPPISDSPGGAANPVAPSDAEQEPPTDTMGPTSVSRR